MNYILVIIIVGVVILLGFQALGLVLVLAMLKKREAQVDGSDAVKRKFCYRVEKSAEEIFSILSLPGHFQDYRYSFDRQEMIITFSREAAPYTRYWVFLNPDDTGCTLRVEIIGRGEKENACSGIQDLFWQHMLDARPIPIFEEERI